MSDIINDFCTQNKLTQFDESTFPQRMLQMVFNNPIFSRDQIIMKSPFHSRKLLFVSHNSRYIPSCGQCDNGLHLRYISGYIKGSITIGICDKCSGLTYQIVHLTCNGDVAQQSS